MHTLVMPLVLADIALSGLRILFLYQSRMFAYGVTVNYKNLLRIYWSGTGPGGDVSCQGPASRAR